MDYPTHSLEGKTALITGASSGIGKATAQLLASHGVNLRLVARRKNILDEIAKEFDGQVKIETLGLDLSDKNSLNEMEKSGFFESDICLNNAGLALGRENVSDSNEDDWDTMLQVNLLNSIKVVKRCLPHMLKNGGDIVSIGSIAGHEAYAQGAVYCASKFGIKAFMESLRKEIYGQDIRTMLVSPGMVETDFSKTRFRGDEAAAEQVYKGMRPMSPEDIAHNILFMLTRPRHMQIADMICLATDQGSATTVKRK